MAKRALEIAVSRQDGSVDLYNIWDILVANSILNSTTNVDEIISDIDRIFSNIGDISIIPDKATSSLASIIDTVPVKSTTSNRNYWLELLTSAQDADGDCAVTGSCYAGLTNIIHFLSGDDCPMMTSTTFHLYVAQYIIAKIRDMEEAAYLALCNNIKIALTAHYESSFVQLTWENEPLLA